jgi:hypothetical protein
MRYSTILSFLLIFCFAGANEMLAQAPQGNAVLMSNYERAFPVDGSVAEFDSLTHQFQIKVWDKNPLVISHKTVRHWWGHDNRDVIEITVIKTWEDIPKAMQKNNELFLEAWSTKEARDSFDKAYNKYFTGKHSDEIYQEVNFSK